MILRFLALCSVLVAVSTACAEVTVIDEQVACKEVEGLRHFAPVTGKSPYGVVPEGCIRLKRDDRFKGPIVTKDVDIYGTNTTTTVYLVEDRQHNRWWLLASAVRTKTKTKK